VTAPNGSRAATAAPRPPRLVFGYFGALEQWYLDGGVRPIARYVEEGLRPMRSIWSTPNEPDS